jgi:hypothetical protein
MTKTIGVGVAGDLAICCPAAEELFFGTDEGSIGEYATAWALDRFRTAARSLVTTRQRRIRLIAELCSAACVPEMLALPEILVEDFFPTGWLRTADDALSAERYVLKFWHQFYPPGS